MNPDDVDLGSEALSGSIARVSLLLIGFLGSVVFARVLGAYGFGAFYLLVALENLVDRPISGVANAAKKRLSESHKDDDVVMSTFWAIYAGFIVIVIIGALIGSRYIDAYVGLDNGAVFFIVLFIALASQDTLSTLLSATGRIGLTNWIDAVRSFLTIPAQVLLILAGLGVFGMTVGLAAASIVTALLIVWILRPSLRLPNRETAVSLWKFARYSIPTRTLHYGYTKAGFLLIGFFTGPAVAGYFEVAQKLTIPALLLGGMASGVLMPQVSKMTSEERDVTDKVGGVFAHTSVLAVPIFFGALAMSRRIVITVYGSEYAPAAAILIGYAAYRIFESRMKPVQSTLDGIDKPDYVLYITMISVVVLIGSGIPLLMRFGPEGMIIAMAATEAFRFVIGMVLVRSAVDIPWVPKPLIHQILSGGIMFAILESIEKFIGFPEWYFVFLTIGIGAIVYIVTLLTLSAQTRIVAWYVTRDFTEDKLKPTFSRIFNRG